MHYANNIGFTNAGYGKSSKVTVIKADWKTIPWEECDKIYNEAADLAEQTAYEQHKESYFKYLSEHPTSTKELIPLPGRNKIRRKAGNNAIVNTFIPRYKLDSFGIHVIAQIVAHISTFKIITMIGEEFSPQEYAQRAEEARGYVCYDEDSYQDVDAVSGLAMVQKYFNTPKMMGIYRFLMLDAKGSYLDKQYAGDARHYCSLVPLILAAFKRQYGIPYETWNRTQLSYVVNPALCKAMLYAGESFDKEELLKLREHGLLWRSGPKIGTLRNPLYTHKLYGMSGTVFEDVPELTQVMFTQIWCAHPDNRTKYMVLSPYSWDSVPASLIAPEVLYTPEVDEKEDSLPWDS